MRETLKRPRAVIVGLAAIAAAVIVVAIVTSIYVFGAGGEDDCRQWDGHRADTRAN